MITPYIVHVETSLKRKSRLIFHELNSTELDSNKTFR